MSVAQRVRLRAPSVCPVVNRHDVVDLRAPRRAEATDSVELQQRGRREILALSEQITERGCTGLLIDVEAEGSQSVVAETLVTGVIRSAEDARSLRPAGRILSTADRMTRMIEQLLDFAQIRQGRGIPLQLAPANLSEITRQVLQELGDANPHARIHLSSAQWTAPRSSRPPSRGRLVPSRWRC
jgi:signal transduction histidine kinase